MKNVKSIIALMAILSMFFIGQVFAQEHNHSHKTEINVDNLGSKKLSRVDKNNDGKIFQCPMHKDQVSDNPGDRPKCGMKLKEIDANQSNNRRNPVKTPQLVKNANIPRNQYLAKLNTVNIQSRVLPQEM